MVNASNRTRLPWLLDPMQNPALEPARRRVKVALRRAGIDVRERSDLRANVCSPREFDSLLAGAGLSKIASTCYGFGPFTVMLREPLSDRAGVALHRALQNLADRNLRGFRSAGAQYLVLARRA